MTIPANIVQNFDLTKDSKLRVTFQNDKLVIDLPIAKPSHSVAAE
jgi:antitoxin component of MazEF toxin-antitoxin module